MLSWVNPSRGFHQFDIAGMAVSEIYKMIEHSR